MTNVIVVEDDRAFLRSVERELRREGISVRCTDDVHEALSWLKQSTCDVLLTDLRMHDVDGLDLIRRARKVSPRTRTVLMSGLASAKEYDTALQLGAVRVLCKPFSHTELVDAIRQAIDCDTGFRGSVHGLGLVDLLQMFHFGQRSLVLSVGGDEGRIYLSGGAIVHAEHGSLRGEDALKALLALPRGVLRTESFNEPQARSIQRDFQELLLDSLRLVDEGADAIAAQLLTYRSSLPAPASSPPILTVPGPYPLPRDLLENSAPSDAERASSAPASGELTARFASALQTLPHRPLTLVVVGMHLSKRKTERLHGGVDAEAFRIPMWEMVEAAMRLSGSSTGMIEQLTPGTIVYVVWDRQADVAILLADGFRFSSEAALLRASIQMFARACFAIDQ